MQIVEHDNAEALLERCQDALLSDPACNHHIIQTATVLCGPNDFYRPPYWFCTVEVRGEVKGAALYAAPDGLVLSDMPSSAMAELYERLVEKVPAPVRVFGRPDLTNIIAEILADRSGFQPVLSTSWHVGRLDSVIKPEKLPPGELRQADTQDAGLVETWGGLYQKEKPSFLNISRYLLKKLVLGDLYLWDSDGPKTMITISGRTENGVRISSVFTPKEHRGSGFASASVAEISQQLLRSGHGFVLVNWRVGDDVGNLYSRLGFQEVGIQQSYINDETIF
jgi:GNAT superfamily N-acetyltransferase